jgi:hypothetical protein
VRGPAVADPRTASGPNKGNRVIHSATLRADIDVLTDLNPAIFTAIQYARDTQAAGAGFNPLPNRADR